MTKVTEEAQALIEMGAQWIDVGTVKGLLDEKASMIRTMEVMLHEWPHHFSYDQDSDGQAAVEHLIATIKRLYG